MMFDILTTWPFQVLMIALVSLLVIVSIGTLISVIALMTAIINQVGDKD